MDIRRPEFPGSENGVLGQEENHWSEIIGIYSTEGEKKNWRERDRFRDSRDGFLENEKEGGLLPTGEE